MNTSANKTRKSVQLAPKPKSDPRPLAKGSTSVVNCSTLVKRPDGKLLEEIIATVLADAPGEWKTVALLIHETGMDYGSARKLQWSQVSETHVRWISPDCFNVGFQSELSPNLKHHLKSLQQTGTFICPSVAMLPGNESRKVWLKECWCHFPKLAKYLKRYSIWRELTAHHDRLADAGQLPVKESKPGGRDLKVYVKSRLQSIIAGEPPTGGGEESPFYNQYRALKLDEIIGLVNNLQGEWQLAVLVLYYLLISVDELCGLKWEQFDLKRGTVNIAKNQIAPIHPTLMTHLLQWSSIKSGKIISYSMASRMSADAARIFASAGITDPRIRLSSVRKTSVLMLKRCGVSITAKRALVSASCHDGGQTRKCKMLEFKKMLIQKLPNIMSKAGT